jgi:uncharacterized metal-binding protein
LHIIICKNIQKMHIQITKDFMIGEFYLTPSIYLYANRGLKIYYIGFKWLRFARKLQLRKYKQMTY